MDSKLLIGVVLLVTIIIVIFVFALNSDDKKRVSLDELTKSLYAINTRLSTIRCITPDDRLYLFDPIDTIKKSGDALIADTDPKNSVKPSSVTNFTNAYNTVDATRKYVLANYKDCSDPSVCFQGTYDEKQKICVCPNPKYPTYTNAAIDPSGKTYCFNQNCPTFPNAVYDFSNPKPDPTLNPSCACIPNFEHDLPSLPNPEYCWNTANSAALDGYSGQLTTINNRLTGEFSGCPGGGNCSGNGVCNPTTGTCTCNVPWISPDCSKQSNMIFSVYNKSGNYYIDKSGNFNVPQTTVNMNGGGLLSYTDPTGTGITKFPSQFTLVFYASALDANSTLFFGLSTPPGVTPAIQYFYVDVPIKAGGTVNMYTQEVILTSTDVNPTQQLFFGAGTTSGSSTQIVLYAGGNTPLCFFSN